MLSILLYAFGLVAAVAALAVIRPISWLGLRTRRRAFVAWLLAFAAGVGTLAWPAHETRVASPVSRLDQIVPVYQFSEVHETTIEASPERTYRTICAVTVNEIALLRTLTFIRRFGQPGPDSILNPPADKPFCEVALSSGFYLLADEPSSEMVLGTFVAAPRAARANPPPQITAATFTAIRSPGFAIAVMNFRLQSIGPTRTRLTTETRVFATDATIRRRFAAYWRVIYPGSSIIRMMWLRAIKRSAELPSVASGPRGPGAGRDRVGIVRALCAKEGLGVTPPTPAAAPGSARHRHRRCAFHRLPGGPDLLYDRRGAALRDLCNASRFQGTRSLWLPGPAHA